MNRAKIFFPFAALKGFDEALREKEKIIENKKLLSEDKISEINYLLHSKEKLIITYYKNNKYITTKCCIKFINNIYLKTDTDIIKTEDIVDIEVLN